MAQTVGEVYVQVLPSTRGLSKDMEKELGGAAKSADRSFGGVFGKFAKRAGIAAVAVTAAFTLKGGISRLLAIDDAEGKLRGLGFTTREVGEVMKNALASVKGTSFGLGEAASAAATAVAAGIKPGKQLTEYLKLTGDAATIAGTSMGEMGTILNKVTTKGRADMGNINQMQERGVPIMQWLAKEYGVTGEAMEDMVSDGKVDAATFQKVLKDNIGGAALESGNTARGAFKNLGASLGRIGANLLSGVFPELKGGATGLTDALAPLEDKAKAIGVAIGTGIRAGVQIFKDLKSAVESTVGFLKDHETTVRVIATTITILLIPAFVAAGVAALKSAAMQVAAWVTTQATAIKSAAVQVLSAWKVIGSWVLMGARATGTAALYGAAFAFMAAEAIKNAVIQVAQNLRAAASWAASTAAMVAQKVVMIAMRAATVAWAAAQWLLNVALTANPIGLIIAAIVGLVAAVVLAYRNSETFRRIVQLVWAGIKIYITTSIKIIIAALRGIWSAISAVIGFFGSLYTGVRNKVSAVLGVVKGLPGKIKGYFSGAGGWLKNVGQNIMSGLLSGINRGLGWVRDKLSGIGRLIPGWLKSVLGIGSPSKVMAKEVGQWILPGVTRGVDKSLPAFRADMMSALDVSSLAATSSLSLKNTGAFGAGIAASGPARVLNYFAAAGPSLSDDEQLFAAASRARMVF